MNRVLLLQLPIPQLNYGKQTGNIPLAAACLAQAAVDIGGVEVEILPESLVSYLGDAALIKLIRSHRPDVIGFSVFCWNVRRSLHLAEKLKQIDHPRIVFGGPEITPDNLLVRSDAVDFFVYGEGEAVFRRLLQDSGFWANKSAAICADSIFRSSPSPYLSGALQPGIENMVLLETQRGCPYHCGFCYYSKSRDHTVYKDESLLLEAVRWTVDHGISELYFLDPTLNARPGLKNLLRRICTINRNRAVSLMSEIRADRVDASMADHFAEAGFQWFEIGLQSTNPQALKLMNRPTRLKRFLEGSALLKERRITPAIDLIAGLPGDDLSGFMRSVDFIAENTLQDDVQVFPLSVLPGTDFRSRSAVLGLDFEPEPPYPVITSPGFSQDDLLLAFDYAEVRFDVCLYPMPDLNVAWRSDPRGDDDHPRDHRVCLEGESYIAKLVLLAERPPAELEALADRVTSPYQVFIGPAVCNPSYTSGVLGLLTAANPFTPLEVIFIEPQAMPHTDRLLSAVRLRRPHFLDLEQRYLFSSPGNRSVLFTLVSQDRRPRFRGDMQRQVYWWNAPDLPTLSNLQSLSELDGILVDSDRSTAEMHDWQDRFTGSAAEFLHIGFANVALQNRWRMLTDSDNYFAGAFHSDS